MGIDSSDQGSPRGVLEIPISSVESDGGSSSESSFGSGVESHSLQWRRLIGGMLMRKNKSMRRLSTFPPTTVGAGLAVSVVRSPSHDDRIEGGGSQSEVPGGRLSRRSFDCQELADASPGDIETGEERKEANKIPMTSKEELNPEEDSMDSSTSAKGTEENRDNLKTEPDDLGIDSSDQGSPRGVMQTPISSVESDGGSSSESSYGLAVESHSLQWRSLIGGLLLRKKRSMRRLSTFPPTTADTRLRGSLAMIQGDEDRIEGEGSHQEVPVGRPTWRSFDYQELAAATDNFSTDKMIGKGGHAEVYKGCLPDGQLVAVKKLTKGDSEEERIRDFLSEIGIIAHVNHPNAAQLLGFSVEGGLHLVLKFSPHGSLASLLHGSKDGLNWGVRFKIALGIAEGLLYLHEGCPRRIIHRDIKASNILLTHDYQPQISDFGLAKWLPDKWTHHIVFPIEGTFGYLAPEYFMHGVVNEKTDVFAFGVLLLELITGRRAVDSTRQSLVIWAKPLLESVNMKELIDPSLTDSKDTEEMRRAVSVASICIHHDSTMRPNMNRVVRLLKGEERVAEFVGRREPQRRPPVMDAGDLENYTCSTYLNDLHRYKQLAMEQ